jgi:hypothetical protein
MHIGATFNRRNHPHTIVRQVLENLNAFIVHRFWLFNASSGRPNISNGTSPSSTSLVVTSATSGSGVFSTTSMTSAS